MNPERADVLVLCYGNPGRLDDGLGAAFAEGLERMKLSGVTVDLDYQLSVEQAADAARHRYVIFADAAVGGREPFSFERIEPGPQVSFSTHSVTPEAVLALAGEFFGAQPEGYALGIRGYEFNGFGERLSPGARENLSEALRFARSLLEERSFDRALAFGPAPGSVYREEERCKTEST